MGKAITFRLTDGEMQGLVVCKAMSLFFFTHSVLCFLKVDTKSTQHWSQAQAHAHNRKKCLLMQRLGFALCFYPEML